MCVRDVKAGGDSKSKSAGGSGGKAAKTSSTGKEGGKASDKDATHSKKRKLDASSGDHSTGATASTKKVRVKDGKLVASGGNEENTNPEGKKSKRTSSTAAAADKDKESKPPKEKAPPKPKVQCVMCCLPHNKAAPVTACKNCDLTVHVTCYALDFKPLGKQAAAATAVKEGEDGKSSWLCRPCARDAAAAAAAEAAAAAAKAAEEAASIAPTDTPAAPASEATDVTMVVEPASDAVANSEESHTQETEKVAASEDTAAAAGDDAAAATGSEEEVAVPVVSPALLALREAADYAVCCSFLNLFSTAPGVSVPKFVLSEFESAWLNSPTSGLMDQMHLPLLRAILKSADSRRWGHQLLRLARENTETFGQLSVDVGDADDEYMHLPLRTRLGLFRMLLEMQFDNNADLRKHITETSTMGALTPLVGTDQSGLVSYYLLEDREGCFRLMKETTGVKGANDALFPYVCVTGKAHKWEFVLETIPELYKLAEGLCFSRVPQDLQLWAALAKRLPFFDKKEKDRERKIRNATRLARMGLEVEQFGGLMELTRRSTRRSGQVVNYNVDGDDGADEEEAWEAER